ncbi:hypothetical protein ACQY0O_004397 [Thecaphora frezii]
MPSETDEQRAERQARLSKAMGAMFLQDKVERLERDVQAAPFSRGMARSRSGPNHAHRLAQPSAPPFNPEGGIRILTRSSTGPGMDRTLTEPIAARPSSSRSQPNKVYLLDTSVLIYSLRSVHEWLKDPQVQIIIPLEAINNLDLLKKGHDPVNSAARKATRFLEERMSAESWSQGSAGLFCQRDDERASLADLESRRKQVWEAERPSTNETRADDSNAPATAEAGVAGESVETQFEDPQAIASCPRFLREMLSAAAFFGDRLNPGEAGSRRKFAVAVSKAPELAPSDVEGEALPFVERADGRLSAEWLEAIGIKAESVSPSKSWTARQRGKSAPSEASANSAKAAGARPPLVLKRPIGVGKTLASHQSDNGVLVPPICGTLRKQAPGRSPSPAGSTHRSEPAMVASTRPCSAAQYGNISILRSRGPANGSQDSLASLGTTGGASSVAGSRNASTTSLSRRSLETLASTAEGGGGGDDVKSAGSGSGSSRKMGAVRGAADAGSSRKTAAARMEEYVRSLS